MMISALSPATRSSVMFKGYSRDQRNQMIAAQIAKMNDPLALLSELNKPNDQTNLFCHQEYDQMDGQYYVKDKDLLAAAEHQFAELLRKAPVEIVRQIDAKLRDDHQTPHYTPSDEVYRAILSRLG